MVNLQTKWDNSHKKIPCTMHAVYAQLREPEFPKKSVICDVGGGRGNEALYFIHKGHEVVLVDISGYGLDQAEKAAKVQGVADRLSTYRVELGHELIPVDDASIDVIFSRLTLQYFRTRTTIRILKDLLRILKPGGRAYIVVKSSADAEELAFLAKTAQEIQKNVFDDEGAIKTRYSHEQWRDMLENAAIRKYKIGDYTEKFRPGDIVKSGKEEMILTEIQFEKV